jgi:hypothetical protein
MELDKKSIQVFILILVAVLVGLAFATSIADTIYETSHVYTQTNESVSIAALRYGVQPNVRQNISLATDFNKLSSTTITMYNATNGKLINTENYTVNLTGINKGYNTYSIYLINTTQWGGGKENTTLITYSYYPENYIPYSNARNILNLIMMFMALIILLIVIDYVLGGKLGELIKR